MRLRPPVEATPAVEDLCTVDSGKRRSLFTT